MLLYMFDQVQICVIECESWATDTKCRRGKWRGSGKDYPACQI